MEALAKQDTYGDSFSDSPRNSYASATESHPRSARSSFTSISDTIPSSARTSYSSLPESFSRASSFSRTLTGFVLETEANTPLSQRDPSLDSLMTWKLKEENTKVENSGILEDSRSQTQEPTHKSKPKDGFEALKGLKNVRNVICVAFGVFDRYYISWEDNNGEFHQECQALPECLNRWLFPSDGQKRDLQSLQVSLGSNDEFFASDKDGKLSSRDPSCQIADKKPVPRLAEIARGMVRKRSHTISSPKLPELISTRVDPNPESPRLVRRSKFQIGQENQRNSMKMPLTEQLKTTRLEPKRKHQTTDANEEDLVVENLEDGTVKKLVTVPQVEQAQVKRLESKIKSNEDEEQPPLRKPYGLNIEQSRRKSILIRPPPPVRPKLARIQTVLETTESLQSRGILECAPVIRSPLPTMKVPSPPRGITLPQRPREIPQAAKVSSYVDAGVQTEIQVEVCGNCAPLQPQPYPTKGLEPYSFLPPQHDISIGYMQDFCRDEYQLGGMLSTYV